jgi:hypothetical protein
MSTNISGCFPNSESDPSYTAGQIAKCAAWCVSAPIDEMDGVIKAAINSMQMTGASKADTSKYIASTFQAELKELVDFNASLGVYF